MINADMAKRKLGRLRAILESLISELLCLYDEGLGYQTVAHELGKQDIWVDWSAIRRIAKSCGHRTNPRYGLGVVV